MEMVASPKKIKRIHPKKFALWTAMVSMIMLFSAFTSAYLVRKAAGNWLSFPIVEEFFYSTGVILSSSVILHVAYKAFVAKNYGLYKVLLTVGFVLGISFVALQYMGWLALNDMGIFISTNQSSSFFVLLIGAHALHVIGGITALMISWIYALKRSTQAWTPKGQLRLELTFTYWHFVDILWLYLLLFLWIQQ
ncbi:MULTISPECIES: cytochrome c oxidase subunit 3 [unclassified Aureispira]|uniref:cytochrome c oxidase subunit 3 n=1 Tax=unclassified Aureispira TaxID=2649989 RepID=UPI000A80B25E|nr:MULTISPECIES: cytochrome c oxidase subunit 3 [unclassified Aureispira]WMX15662.1 cytochrome c oxidase subunit 3 [Aureispira sp. CCB-E]